MCSMFLRWLIGYKIIRQVDDGEIPISATHILSIKSENFMKVRTYNMMNNFFISKVRSFDVAYNNITDEVFSNNYTNFEKLKMSEFLHIVVPNEKLHIYHITKSSYMNNTNIYDFYEIFEPDGNLCKCTHSESRKCLYHNFVLEKLYSKYIKNDSSTENTDFCNKYDNDWSMV